MSSAENSSSKSTIVKYAISRVFRQLLGALTAYLRPKLLSPEQFGLWTLLKVALTYSSFLHLGSRSAMRIRIPAHAANGEEEECKRIGDTVFCFALALNGALAAVLAALGCWGGFETEARVGLLAVSALLFLQFYYDHFISILRARQQFALVGQGYWLQSAVGLCLTIPLLHYFKFYGLLLSAFLTVFVVVAYFRMKFDLHVSPRFDFAVWRRLASIGFPIMVLNFAVMLISTSDRLIVSLALGRTELGFYGIAALAVGFLTNIPGSAQEVLEPKLMERVRSEPHEKVQEMYLLRPLVNAAYLMTFLSGVAFLAAPAAIGFLLPRYVAGIEATQVLMLGGYFMGLCYPLRCFLAAMNWQRLALIPALFVLLINIVVSVILAKSGWGITGVAIGSALSFFLLFLLFFVLVALKAPSRAAGWRLHAWGIFIAFPCMAVAVAALSRVAPLLIENRYLGDLLSVAILCFLLWILHRTAERRLPFLDPLPLPKFLRK